jgi:hypothetical protein
VKKGTTKHTKEHEKEEGKENESGEGRCACREFSSCSFFVFSAKIADGMAVERFGLDCGGASPPLWFF